VHLEEVEALYSAYTKDPDNLSKQTALFEACYKVARSQITVYTYHSDVDPEDITQDVVFAAWQSLPTKKPEVMFSFWLLNVLRNKTNDALRKKYQRSFDPLSDVMPTNAWESSYCRLEAIDTSDENKALLRFLYADFDVKAAAAHFGWTEGAVQQRLHRLRSAQRTAQAVN